MQDLFSMPTAHGVCARVGYTTKADGDLSPAAVPEPELVQRRERLVGSGAWHSVNQVHSDQVLVVTDELCPTATIANRPRGDALVTRLLDNPIAVHSGDCVLIALVHSQGAIAVAHGGWKGLFCGVIESTARALRYIAGPGKVTAAVGPHIKVGQYEFGEVHLEQMVWRFGPQVVGQTDDNRRALDLGRVAASELERLGVAIGAVARDCTAANPEAYWSHRRRGEIGRLAMVGWLERCRS